MTDVLKVHGVPTFRQHTDERRIDLVSTRRVRLAIDDTLWRVDPAAIDRMLTLLGSRLALASAAMLDAGRTVEFGPVVAARDQVLVPSGSRLSGRESVGFLAVIVVAGGIAVPCLARHLLAVGSFAGLIALATIAAWVHRSLRWRTRRSSPWTDVAFKWSKGVLNVQAPGLDVAIPGHLVPNAIALERLAELASGATRRAQTRGAF